jgi:hypothetical protein
MEAVKNIQETLSQTRDNIVKTADGINKRIDNTIFGETKPENQLEQEAQSEPEKTVIEPMEESVQFVEEKTQPLPEVEPIVESEMKQPEPEEPEQIKDLKVEPGYYSNPITIRKTKKNRKTKKRTTTKQKKRCKKGQQRNRKSHRCNKKCPPGTKPSYTRKSKKRKCTKKI